MSPATRSLLGCAALAAALCVVGARAADAPAVPTESYKKAAAADVKFLQTRLDEIAKKQAAGTKVPDGQVKPALGVALALAAYGDVLGDSALKGDAVKVAEAIAKKDFKAAEGLAKGLAVKPGAAGKPGPLPKPLKDDLMLAAAMSPFRGSSVGGLGIDKEIKDLSKVAGAAKIDPAAVEILAVRSAVLNAYGQHSPNDKARTNAANQKLWEKWASESTNLSNELAAEAGKGAQADEKKLKALLTGLNARCSDCHNKFRDDE